MFQSLTGLPAGCWSCETNDFHSHTPEVPRQQKPCPPPKKLRALQNKGPHRKWLTVEDKRYNLTAILKHLYQTDIVNYQIKAVLMCCLPL